MPPRTISPSSRLTLARAGTMLVLLIAFGAADILAGEDWTGFRGQQQQGVGSAQQAPVSWPPSMRLRVERNGGRRASTFIPSSATAGRRC